MIMTLLHIDLLTGGPLGSEHASSSGLVMPSLVATSLHSLPTSVFLFCRALQEIAYTDILSVAEVS